MTEPEEIEQIFAANLKALREAKGLSQADLAELASLSTTTVYRFEAMDRWAKPANVMALARALGCSPSRFYSTGEEVVPAAVVDLATQLAQVAGLKVSRA